jgi:folate-dependent phosphoribosylglycinamide formyltransferase PurN
MEYEIAILAGDTPWTWALASALRQHFGEIPVIVEDKEPTALFLRRRIKRLGLARVIGQVGLGILARVLRPFYRHKERAILREKGLDATPLASAVTRVPSVNDPRTIDVLQRLRPKILVVSQTRILRRDVLSAIPATFINVHTGITPKYRGMHGAYWALASGDDANCGVTVHVVDDGIDTGPIIAQARITPTPSDSYFTYHWAQLAAALPLLIRAIEDARADRLATFRPKAETASRLFYHPTLWGYVWVGLRQGVW